MGSYYKERANFFNSLNNISFDVWGYGWQKNQKYLNKNVKIKKKIFDTRKKTRDIPKTAKLFNESRINLNIHHSQAKNGGLNLRAFEIPATNSFQISNFVKGTRDLFKKDELICFNNNNELKELISYYLENKEERNKITKKGFLRVKKDHTFKVRMKQMMDKIH